MMFHPVTRRGRTSLVSQPGRITRWLQSAPAPVFVGWAIAASFSTYFCMYAFRKPFSAATYEGLAFFGTEVNLKTALVISQLIGYTLSKYVGIKVCSEVTRGRRATALVLLILTRNRQRLGDLIACTLVVRSIDPPDERLPEQS